MFEYFKNLYKKQPKVVPHGNYATTESKQIRKDEIFKTDFNAPSKATAKVNIKQSLGRQVRPNTPDYIRNSVESDLKKRMDLDDSLAFIAQQGTFLASDKVQVEEKKEPVMCKADYQFTVDEHKSHTSYSPSYSDSSSSSSSYSDSSSSSCSSSSSSCD